MESEYLKKLRELTPKLPPLSNAVISRTIDHGVEEVDYKGEEGTYRGTFCYKDKYLAVNQLTIPKGTTTAKHAHEGAEHCFVYSGKILVEYEGKAEIYGKGECFEMPANKVYVGTALTETKCIIMLINGEDKGFPKKTADRKS